MGVCRRSNVKTQALNIHPRSGELLSTDPPRGEAPRGRIRLKQLARARVATKSLHLYVKAITKAGTKGYNAGYIKGFAWGKRAGEVTPRVTPYLRPRPPATPPPGHQ